MSPSPSPVTLPGSSPRKIDDVQPPKVSKTLKRKTRLLLLFGT